MIKSHGAEECAPTLDDKFMTFNPNAVPTMHCSCGQKLPSAHGHTQEYCPCYTDRYRLSRRFWVPSKTACIHCLPSRGCTSPGAAHLAQDPTQQCRTRVLPSRSSPNSG